MDSSGLVTSFLLILCTTIGIVHVADAAGPQIVIASTESNDVYKLLSTAPPSLFSAVVHVDSIDSGLLRARDHDVLLVLADDYPTSPTSLTEAQLLAARAKSVAVFIEYPSAVPGLDITAPAPIDYFQRVVVVDPTALTNSATTSYEREPTEAARALAKMDLLMANGANFVNITCSASDAVCSLSEMLVFARVAGVDTAVYGVADTVTTPLLFTVSNNDEGNNNRAKLIVSSTKLSDIVTGRYMPAHHWRAVWSTVLEALRGHTNNEAEVTMPPTPTATEQSFPEWQELVVPNLGPSESVTLLEITDTFDRATNWLQSASGLVIRHDTTRCPVVGNTSVGTAVSSSSAVSADASLSSEMTLDVGATDVTCVLEGFGSGINWNGTQQLAGDVRIDCNAETAMALALRGYILHDTASTHDAKQIMDYIYIHSEAQQGPRANISNPQYGLIIWGVSSPAWEACSYGDDNARVLLASYAAAATLNSSAYDQGILRALYANARLASDAGFRPGRVEVKDIEAKGWEWFHNEQYTYYNVSSPNPHYQSYIWASFLWGYERTGSPVLLNRAKAGLEGTVTVYINEPEKWITCEYASEELSHMILPLAWLHRIEPTDEHAKWLRMFVDGYIRRQTKCGAIAEFLGNQTTAECKVPTSNAAYGMGENPLIQSDTDTVADLLYSNNFALVGLQEAATTLNDQGYAAAASQLGDFMVRAQARSTAVPSLEGAYFRAFDFDNWQFWGSSSDWGWGPWSVETGWTQGWIAAGLGFKVTDTNFWDWTHGRSSIDPVVGMRVCHEFFGASGAEC